MFESIVTLITGLFGTLGSLLLKIYPPYAEFIVLGVAFLGSYAFIMFGVQKAKIPVWATWMVIGFLLSLLLLGGVK